MRRREATLSSGLSTSAEAPTDGGDVLTVNDLCVSFGGARGPSYEILRDVSFSVGRGKCVGIVGESGSGKSMACLAMMGLLPRFGQASGKVILQGRNIFAMSPSELREVRGAELAIVFQDPSAALNPLLTVRRHIGDVLAAHRFGSRAAIRDRTVEVLTEVGFPNPASRLGAYPFQLSGGLRQRVAIAMALACRPSVIIADEPTTNLDVSVQEKVLDLLVQQMARDRFGMVFVSHDLGVISRVSDTVLVMYGGQVVEYGRTAEVLRRPAHPYTRNLLAAAPTMSMDRHSRLVPIPGSLVRVPGPIPPCAFATRCPDAQTTRCEPSAPRWHRLGSDASHGVYCAVPVGSTEAR